MCVYICFFWFYCSLYSPVFQLENRKGIYFHIIEEAGNRIQLSTWDQMHLGFWMREGRRKRLTNWGVKGNETIHILIHVEYFGVGGLFLFKLQEHWPLLEQPESYFAAHKSLNSLYKFRMNHWCTESPMQKIHSLPDRIDKNKHYHAPECTGKRRPSSGMQKAIRISACCLN